MADINQTNNKEKQVSEFENLLQVYTEKSLYTVKVDADGNIIYDDKGNPILEPKLSELPPQTRTVAESLVGVQKRLEAKDTQLDERVSTVETKFEQLSSNVTSKVNSNSDLIVTAINDEYTRATTVEKKLSDRITAEENRLDDFFKAAEVGEIAIDTLVEIQK
jgi:hypothetical protein